MAGDITPGRLSQFVLYAVFAASGLGQLSEVWGEISQASGAAERLFEILRVKPEIQAAGTAGRAARARARRDRLRRRALRLSDAAGNARCSTACRCACGRGEKVAIVGPSGAGKSTIFHLILRFYDPVSGTVTFDGVPLARRRSVRAAPAHRAGAAGHRRSSPPPSPTISASAGPTRATPTSSSAAELALAAEFIRRLPQGFDTPVGERGVTLSGGQRQRIAIARAILRDAPLLLLDEATSSLDAESETLVQAALERLMAERTTLVIAHRLATVLSCDRILVMDDGRIVEEGTHAQLAAAGGLYARLAKLQFQNV